MQYEYLRMYLNHNICCPRCLEPFLAKELPMFPTQTYEKVRREREEAQAEIRTEESLSRNHNPLKRHSGAGCMVVPVIVEITISKEMLPTQRQQFLCRSPELRATQEET
ncbi:hypothetical protein EJB05_29246, partial [Eragrostis curvula]